jgi:hypothetical protein
MPVPAVRIPYFDGRLRAIPYVRLRSLSSGIEVWFGNFHNPADTATYHHQQRYQTTASVCSSTGAHSSRRQPMEFSESWRRIDRPG